MKVKLKYIEVFYVVANDFTKNGTDIDFKLPIEKQKFSEVLTACRNILLSQNFVQFNLRPFSAKGSEAFVSKFLNVTQMPAVVWVDYDNPNAADFKVLTTLNLPDLNENRMYDMADYFASLSKESGVYYQKDGNVWADLRNSSVSFKGKPSNSTQKDGTPANQDANANGVGFLPIYIPILSEFSEVLDKFLESLGIDYKKYMYLGLGAIQLTSAAASDNKTKQILLGGGGAYCLYRFKQLSENEKPKK